MEWEVQSGVDGGASLFGVLGHADFSRDVPILTQIDRLLVTSGLTGTMMMPLRKNTLHPTRGGPVPGVLLVEAMAGISVTRHCSIQDVECRFIKSTINLDYVDQGLEGKETLQDIFFIQE